MTIDKQALRQLATDAHELGIIKRYSKGLEAQRKFYAAATPLVIRALLDELEALQSFRTAFNEWHDKTEWVQGDKRFDVIKPWGKHRADVLKLYIDHLESKLEAAEHTAAVDHEAACSLVEENEELKRRIAELQSSHSKLRDTLAAIHNTIKDGGAYTPLAAILNAAKRAHEESAAAAGIGKVE